jgi:hypothetical protein
MMSGKSFRLHIQLHGESRLHRGAARAGSTTNRFVRRCAQRDVPPPVNVVANDILFGTRRMCMNFYMLWIGGATGRRRTVDKRNLGR